MNEIISAVALSLITTLVSVVILSTLIYSAAPLALTFTSVLKRTLWVYAPIVLGVLVVFNLVPHMGLKIIVTVVIFEAIYVTWIWRKRKKQTKQNTKDYEKIVEITNHWALYQQTMNIKNIDIPRAHPKIALHIHLRINGNVHHDEIQILRDQLHQNVNLTIRQVNDNKAIIAKQEGPF